MWRSCSALNSSNASGLIGPRMRSSRSRSRTRAAPACPRAAAAAARLGDHGFDVELAAQRLDRRLQPELGLGLVELGLARPLARLVELRSFSARCSTVAVESVRQAANLVALPAALLRELGVARPRRRRGDRSTTVRRAGRWRRACARSADARSAASAARLGVGGEAALGLGRGGARAAADARAGRHCALRDPAPRRQRRSAALELGAQLTAARAASASACSSDSSAGSSASSSAMRWSSRSSRSVEVGDRAFEVRQLGAAPRAARPGPVRGPRTPH